MKGNNTSVEYCNIKNFKTLNPELRTQNSEPGTQNPEPGTLNFES